MAVGTRAKKRGGFSKREVANKLARWKKGERVYLGDRRNERAWERTGDLLDSTAFEVRAVGTEIRLVVMNRVKNERGKPYAVPRHDLGNRGRRKNSIWTMSTRWQEKALARVKPRMDRRLATTIDRTLGM